RLPCAVGGKGDASVAGRGRVGRGISVVRSGSGHGTGNGADHFGLADPKCDFAGGRRVPKRHQVWSAARRDGQQALVWQLGDSTAGRWARPAVNLLGPAVTRLSRSNETRISMSSWVPTRVPEFTRR